MQGRKHIEKTDTPKATIQKSRRFDNQKQQIQLQFHKKNGNPKPIA